MPDSNKTGSSTLLRASDVAQTLHLRRAPNGVRYASFGETRLPDPDLDRIVQAVPQTLVQALADRAFYFVPLAMAEAAAPETPIALAEPASPTLISTVYTPELSDEAICHRNVPIPASADEAAHEGVFISARLLADNFALAFELFINVSHAYAAQAGVPEEFAALAWAQATANTRGETSQDAWEARADALPGTPENQGRRPVSIRQQPIAVVPPAPARTVNDEARADFLEAAFSDALAIYQLSLAVDFDYSELREREYPLLAPQALAERLRLVARLFPPNAGYDFNIRYRRRA